MGAGCLELATPKPSELSRIPGEVHLFAIEDGQSSKLFERRSKTRHTSQGGAESLANVRD